MEFEIPQEILDLIFERQNELLKNKSVQKKLIALKRDEERQQYLTRLAIATLYGIKQEAKS